MNTRISVQFLGGTADGQDPTGSCIALEIATDRGKSRFLVDMGLIQCRFRESLERNLEILNRIKPKDIDGVILTHAHIDHSGRLPLLVKNGFGGKILCTQETAHLLPIMLEDNVKIQLSEASYRKRKMRYQPQIRHSESQTWLGGYDRAKEKEKAWKRYDRALNEPLYTMKHVKDACSLVDGDGHAYGEWIRLNGFVDLKFYRSGHVLGGAVCVVRVRKYDGFTHLGFTGDLGRDDGMILPPPETVEEPIDHWFTESTYGGRAHPPRQQEVDRLMGLIKEAVAEKRKVIIPSFALERTQEMIYLISKHAFNGDIPGIKIFLDSPMAEKITEVFRETWHLPHLFRGQEELRFNPFDPWQNKMLKLVENQDESSKLIERKGPHIVIAGSGMCDAGRVRGHLRQGLPNVRTTVCLVGYMAQGSLGRKLKEHWPLIRMNGREIRVRARIESFESFSAHADSDFLNTYAKRVIERSGHPFKNVFIVHGEKKSALDLKIELIYTLGMPGERINIPRPGETFEL
jgi:metallo-beta-lactamase family protein